MPFFDDSGPRVEDERGLFWRSIALVGDQLERMLLLNIAWSLQLVPLLLAWAFPGWPAWLRTALIIYSAAALLPATATLFAALFQASAGAPLSPELVGESLRASLKPAFLKLLPLFSLFTWAALLAWFANQNGWLPVDVLARLALLCLAVLGLYWGSLLVDRPELSALAILRRSLALFWRAPGKTLLAWLLSLLTLIVGVVSIGGFFLIVPVLLVLIQVQLYRFVHNNL